MTMPHDYPNSGILFKNDKKTSDKAPDYTGTLTAVCPECGRSFGRKLAGWVRTAKTGAKFLVLSFKPQREEVRDNDISF